jgi:hypothetical protein
MLPAGNCSEVGNITKESLAVSPRSQSVEFADVCREMKKGRGLGFGRPASDPQKAEGPEEQVAVILSQVSDSSQSLSQGSTEQVQGIAPIKRGVGSDRSGNPAEHCQCRSERVVVLHAFLAARLLTLDI